MSEVKIYNYSRFRELFPKILEDNLREKIFEELPELKNNFKITNITVNVEPEVRAISTNNELEQITSKINTNTYFRGNITNPDIKIDKDKLKKLVDKIITTVYLTEFVPKMVEFIVDTMIGYNGFVDKYRDVYQENLRLALSYHSSANLKGVRFIYDGHFSATIAPDPEFWKNDLEKYKVVIYKKQGRG